MYLDEDVHDAVASGLRRRGYDAVTTIEAGRSGTFDVEQLHYAIATERCLFSFNRGDFARLHAALIREGRHHCGIVICRQAPPGIVVRRLAALLGHHVAKDFADQPLWLKLDE